MIRFRREYLLKDVFRFWADIVVTSEGNTYAKIPFWFEIQNDGIVLHETMPEDLSEFVTKAGLGGDNPQIIKPEI